MLPFILLAGAAVAAVAAAVSSSSDSSSSSSSSGSSRDYEREAAEKARNAKLQANKEAAERQLKAFLQGHGIEVDTKQLQGLVQTMVSQPTKFPTESLKKAFLRNAPVREIDGEIKVLERHIAERNEAKTFLNSLPIG
ncbi:hypothetical protein ACM7HV_26930 [Pseudomonas paraeruginosa]|uniref:Uncharacterized protein n=1 Tax=Pseudomonas aeruginosa TaxID=287 RepID=A0ABD7JX92_PSEAI|nr:MULTISPECIES: hypothetical protein [Pseudomonas]MCE1080147.1 hypothetical protein [Pseudomonas asiatica]MDM9597111.1 hypothetical protein [Pseudomonas shirazica]MDO2415931.1 hypothetical protein [Pseudomonas shirazica]RTR93298.1 hypothetical protein DY932_24275 [Pseudomonas paraeruginosa]RTS42304.1 hypothetical protein DY940_23865 [Pseudomonas aeruginosa]